MQLPVVLHRTQVAERRMPTHGIVPVVNERGNRALRLAVWMEVGRRDEFVFEWSWPSGLDTRFASR